MLFNSFSFLLLFLPVVAVVHAVLARRAGARAAQAWLLGSSLFFYGQSKPSFLLLLLGSIVFNWAVARWMMAQSGEDGRRLLLLRAGITANIALLCSFKYVNFALINLAALGGPRLALPDWDFPLGISFFTLTQVMYLVDTYQGLNQPNSLFDHATLVSLFPYVSSGPLVRSRSIVAQFHAYSFAEGRLERACRGLYLFAFGLFKKVALADSFTAIADTGFGAAHNLSTLEAWIASLAYTFQIYFDFSGYSDMAVGAAWIMGIDIPQNFNAPFRAKSISEFWQRWHISLSSFITNYLFTPILRSMGKATLRTSALATLLAMGIAGLWHGPAWTFVLFGLLHGAGLAANQIWKKKKLKMPDWLGVLATFVFVNITFVFFRSPSIAAALEMLRHMLPQARLFGFRNLALELPLTPLTLLRPVAAGVVVAFAFQSSAELAANFRTTRWTAAAAAALLLASLLFINSTAAKQFVYFAF